MSEHCTVTKEMTGMNNIIAESDISALWPAAKLNIGTADDGRALYRTYVYIELYRLLIWILF